MKPIRNICSWGDNFYKIIIKRHYLIFLSVKSMSDYKSIQSESSQVTNLYLIKMKPKYVKIVIIFLIYFFTFKIEKICLLFFEIFWGDFSISSYYRKKKWKLSGQIVSDMLVHKNLNDLRKFIILSRAAFLAVPGHMPPTGWTALI